MASVHVVAVLALAVPMASISIAVTGAAVTVVVAVTGEAVPAAVVLITAVPLVVVLVGVVLAGVVLAAAVVAAAVTGASELCKDDLRPCIVCDVMDCQKANSKVNFQSTVQFDDSLNLTRSTFAMVGNTIERDSARC